MQMHGTPRKKTGQERNCDFVFLSRDKCQGQRRILSEVSTQRCEPSEVHPDHLLLRDPQAKTVHETIKRNQRAKD